MRSGTKKKKSNKPSKPSANELARHYPAIFEWDDEDKIYVARVPSLMGCMSHGATMQEAAANILDAAAGWLQTAIDDEAAIPPKPTGMSGKLLVRVPKALHESIARRAEIEGVSINHWIVAVLSRADALATS